MSDWNSLCDINKPESPVPQTRAMAEASGNYSARGGQHYTARGRGYRKSNNNEENEDCYYNIPRLPRWHSARGGQHYTARGRGYRKTNNIEEKEDYYYNIPGWQSARGGQHDTARGQGYPPDNNNEIKNVISIPTTKVGGIGRGVLKTCDLEYESGAKKKIVMSASDRTDVTLFVTDSEIAKAEKNIKDLTIDKEQASKKQEMTVKEKDKHSILEFIHYMDTSNRGLIFCSKSSTASDVIDGLAYLGFSCKTLQEGDKDLAKVTEISKVLEELNQEVPSELQEMMADKDN